MRGEIEVIGCIIVGACAGAVGYALGLFMAVFIIKCKIKELRKLKQSIEEDSDIKDLPKEWAKDQLDRETEAFEKMLDSIVKTCKIIDISKLRNKE